MPSSGPRDRIAGRAAVPHRDDARVPVRGSARVGAPGSVPLSAPPGQFPPGERGGTYRGGPRPRWGRIVLVLGLALAIIAGFGAGGAWLYYYRLNSGLQRTDPFEGITGGRPAREVHGALNILMLGSDSRDPDTKAGPGKWRTDTMIILHITASHDKAYLISIPRDLYVYVPKTKSNPKNGNTKAKINAAYAWGGLPLVVQTIEGYTGVRMDHVVLIDFAGFKQVTDALGGVDMPIDQDIKSIHPPYRHFKKGVSHLNGTEALDYVRQRYQFADGDFARMRHQQQFMKVLLDKAASSGTLSNPGKLNAFLKSVTAAMTVDKGFSLGDMALQFRGIRSDDLVFMVNPHLGSHTINGESVVVSDNPKATALYKAVKSDTVSDWVTQNSQAPARASSTPSRSGG